MTQPFIGLDDLGSLLGEDLTGSDLAVIAIDSACEAVRGYIDNQVNLVEDESILLDGSGTPRLLLPRPPVRSVFSCALSWSGELEELVEGADWVLEGMGSLRRSINGSPSIWPKGFGNVTVVYSHGWWVEEPDDPEYVPEGFERVPSDMRRVALELSKRLFQDAAQQGGLLSEQIGNYAYSLSPERAAQGSAALYPSEKGILDRYRREILS